MRGHARLQTASSVIVLALSCLAALSICRFFALPAWYAVLGLLLLVAVLGIVAFAVYLRSYFTDIVNMSGGRTRYQIDRDRRRNARS